MAIYRLSITALSRSDGRSALAAAAYRAGERLLNVCDFFSKQPKTHDYRRRSGVVATAIILPDHAPAAFTDRQTLWNAAERMERRKDSRVAREILLALPHELTDEQRQEAVTQFIKAHVVGAYGVGADYAIHRPDKRGDHRNHHAHILITTRAINGAGFKPTIMQELNDKAQSGAEIKKLRKEWEIICNEALTAANIAERVDCRSLEERGIERLPEPKQGAIATQIEREGRSSHAGAERRVIKLFNDAVAYSPKKQKARHIKQAVKAMRTRRRHNIGIAAWLLNKTRTLLKAALRHKHGNIPEILRRKRTLMQATDKYHRAQDIDQNYPQAPPIYQME